MYNNNYFVKIAMDKLADVESHINAIHDIADSIRDAGAHAQYDTPFDHDVLEHVKGGIHRLGDSAHELWESTKGRASELKDALAKAIGEHPFATAGGGLGLSALGAGAAGALGRGFSKARKAAKRNKRLALLAALGIPATAGASYLALRDKKK